MSHVTGYLASESKIALERVKQYRQELRQIPYEPLLDDDLKRVKGAFERMHLLCVSDGVAPTPETAALMVMFVEEKVPLSLADQIIDRFFGVQSG